ncbi:MAG: zinc ribbon domain-containing protein [Bacteroidaceae bacterium]|nr:zinc ribbon domain-containing protein [Bacteroidaceae bacterium]
MEEQKELHSHHAQQVQEQAQEAAHEEVQQYKVCPHCHTVNEPDACFCEECGTALGSARLCPNCRQPLDLLADFCEHCKTYVCKDRCSFCGADISETDTFCPECGTPREGIVCPACHTRNWFSYCRVCGIPLTEEARQQSRTAREEPLMKQMDALATELEKLRKIIPADTPRQIDRNQQNMELCKRVRKLLGRENPIDSRHDITLRLGETTEEINERIEKKRDELQKLLDSIAVQPQENPIVTRNFVMARKPASARIGWKCNFKQAIHSSPCGCACPQLGGKWVVLGKDAKMEDDL